MLANMHALVDAGGADDSVIQIAGQLGANRGALHWGSSLGELSRENLLRAETVAACRPKAGAKPGRGILLELTEALPPAAASLSSIGTAATADRSASNGSRRSFSARRPRRMRDFTVPTLHSSTSAISS